MDEGSASPSRALTRGVSPWRVYSLYATRTVLIVCPVPENPVPELWPTFKVCESADARLGVLEGEQLCPLLPQLYFVFSPTERMPGGGRVL